MSRHRLYSLIKVIVSLGLVTALLSQISFQQVLLAFAEANVYYWLLGLATHLLGVVIRAFRWQILLRAQDVHVSVAVLVQLNFIAFLFNNILPTRLGGDVAKTYELSRDGKRVEETVNSVFVDSAMNMLVALFMAMVAALVGQGLVSREIITATVALFLGGLLVMGLLTRERLWELVFSKAGFLRRYRDGVWTERIKGVYRAFRRYDLGSILGAIGVSFIFFFTRVLSIYFGGLAFGIDVSPLYFVVFVPIVTVITLIPISVNGLGLRELSYVTLFSQIGVAEQAAFSLSLSIYAFTVVSGVVGGVLYMLRGARGYMTQEVGG